MVKINKEEKFKHGQSNSEVVKVGDTVRRSIGAHSTNVHKLLNFLEENDFDYSPRFLGIDDQNREIISFIEGDLCSEVKINDQILVDSMKILKRFHDLLEGSEFASGQETLCHTDFAPWNLLVKDGRVVGMIDFDDISPGKRIDDLAYAVWTFLDLGGDLGLEAQLKRISLMIDTYQDEAISGLAEAIISQQEKILQKRIDMSMNSISIEVREFSKSRISEIESQIKWVKDYANEIDSIISS